MKSITNDNITKTLRNMAAAYSIKDRNKYKFQIIAYQKAADYIENLTFQITDLIAKDPNSRVQGIGKSIQGHLSELAERGRVEHFDSILSSIPPSVFPLLDVPGLGPQKANKLVSSLGLADSNSVINDIYKLAKENKISSIPSFGKKSQDYIIKSIEEYRLGKNKSSRMILPTAQNIAEDILSYLNNDKFVTKAYALGSLRRAKSTIGDIDIAAISENPAGVIQNFISYPFLDRVVEKGKITATITARGNKQVDLMVLKPNQAGSLLQHFTGSKDHNIKLREIALKKGLSLSEKGIKLRNGSLKTFDNEESFYNFLGLDWIPPEIRENQGEIELAAEHKLPNLIETKNIKGDLHIHSNFPIEPSHDSGVDDMQKMINEAVRMNFEYIGFSEHNPSLSNHTEKEIYNLLVKRNNKIEQLRKNNKNVRIFNLLEVDILPTGKLALSKICSDLLDMMLVSIHSSFQMEKSEMTKRIIRALSGPKAKILSHPTGRLINRRPGYEVEWDELFSFVKSTNKALEINGWPTRLDLPDNLVRRAKDKRVRFTINSDSHAAAQMVNMKYGVSVARRGWLEKEDVINALSAREIQDWMSS